MLNKDVVEAVASGKFHLYPVKTIDEGISLLTGVEAGARNKDGTFEEGTVNCLVDQELQRLARSWKTFAASDDKNKNN
jgi:ATP-dependent Lon protease